MTRQTRTRFHLHIKSEPTDRAPHPPSKPTAPPIIDILRQVMFPSSNTTESWPRKRDGTILASAPDRAPRNYQPPSGVERTAPNYPQPSNRPTKHPHAPEKAPHDERPPPVVERITPTYYQPANPPGPSHRPTKHGRVTDKASRDERPPPVGERMEPTKRQPANPPEPSHRPTKYIHVTGKARDERNPAFGKIVFAKHQPANPPGPTESAPVIPLNNMPVNFTRRVPGTVRAKMLRVRSLIILRF